MAMAKAEELELDLVEVNSNERPPICKIMDYGKHKYTQAKMARESKKTRFVQETKEIKMTPKIGVHDIDFKTKHAREFLEAGHKVRLLVRFRGREVVHPETGRDVLRQICEELEDVCATPGEPQMEQRQMLLTIVPSARTKARAKTKETKGPS